MIADLNKFGCLLARSAVPRGELPADAVRDLLGKYPDCAGFRCCARNAGVRRQSPRFDRRKCVTERSRHLSRHP